MLHEAVETWFHVDHSFLHGLYTLLFRPGVITSDYNAGRRARHVPSFRFYLVASLLFFFVFLPHSGEDLPTPNTDVRGDMILNDEKGQPIDHARLEKEIQLSDDVPPFLRDTLIKSIEHPRKVAEDFLHKLPKVLLLLLPVFALLTRITFGRARFLYVQHLVLSLHVHTFFLFATVALYGLALLLGLAWSGFAVLLALGAPLYFAWHYYATLHRVFTASWKRTLFLGTLVGGIYGFCILLALPATLAASVIGL